MRSLLIFLFFICGLAPGVPVATAQVVNFETEIRKKGFGKNVSREKGVGTWKKGTTTFEIYDRKRYALINGTRIYLGHSPSYDHKKFFVKKQDWEKRLSPIAAPPKTKAPRRIILDPGHGGKDPGKVNSRGMQEKSYVLDIARRAGRILKARGYTVALTRDGDTALSLSSRPGKANTWKADLFVSIHLNSASTKKARGVETFALTPVGETSTHDNSGTKVKAKADVGNAKDVLNSLFAFKLHSALVDKIDAEDRGVKYANFAVLRPLKCPGVLVECGFLTNASDTALVSTKNGRERIAIGIADGIDAYVKACSTLPPKPKKK